MTERWPAPIGKKFERLTVLERFVVAGRAHWRCKCDCGKITTPLVFTVTNGQAKSCGCYHGDFLRVKMKGSQFNLRHGHRTKTFESPTHISWRGMKNRCLNKNSPDFKRYGGAKVTVCERWMSFENFLKDMGLRPERTSIDRINPFGNYEPSNCRWATMEEQQNNRRATYVA